MRNPRNRQEWESHLAVLAAATSIDEITACRVDALASGDELLAALCAAAVDGDAQARRECSWIIESQKQDRIALNLGGSK